jgi:hypothetical protein
MIVIYWCASAVSPKKTPPSPHGAGGVRVFLDIEGHVPMLHIHDSGRIGNDRPTPACAQSRIRQEWQGAQLPYPQSRNPAISATPLPLPSPRSERASQAQPLRVRSEEGPGARKPFRPRAMIPHSPMLLAQTPRQDAKAEGNGNGPSHPAAPQTRATCGPTPRATRRPQPLASRQSRPSAQQKPSRAEFPPSQHPSRFPPLPPWRLARIRYIVFATPATLAANRQHASTAPHGPSSLISRLALCLSSPSRRGGGVPHMWGLAGGEATSGAPTRDT